MKGDFSRWAFDPAENYTGVLMQQGRVLADTDVTAITQIATHWRETMGQDVVGPDAVAAPAALPGSFRVTAADLDGSAVKLTLEPGRAWVDGVLVHSPGADPFPRHATYLGPPFQATPATPATIAANVHDAVVLEVWEEELSAFQEVIRPKVPQPAGADPVFKLLEPALGGPDTTERSRVYFGLRLLRVGADDDCATVAACLTDDPASRGRLTVTPAPSIFMPGDCPLEAGGGYTGLEHCLYRIEIAESDGAQARFKWSRFNGGLVGRGVFKSPGGATGTVDVRDNAPTIDQCGRADFYLEALALDSNLGYYQVKLTANASRAQAGQLELTDIKGTWPADAPNAFFRLWDGIARVSDFPVGGTPVELGDGIQVQFQAPAPNLSNYRPGDYWTFPVRTSGTRPDPSLWPTDAAPQGVRVHRAPLAIIHWQGDRKARHADGTIVDCRRVFRPLINQKTCCTFTVGDGESTHGDFDSIQEAVDSLPMTGGHICLLPGVHQAGVRIVDRFNVAIHGCGIRTKVVPLEDRRNPLFTITDSEEVVLEGMDMANLDGTAVAVEGSTEGAAKRIEVRDNRILAFEMGLRVRNGRWVSIQHNRIRMMDKPGAGVAIYLQADDSEVERNEIAVVPAPETPPIDVPTNGGVIRPTDPCARFTAVYRTKRIMVRYLNSFWRAVFVPTPAAPYQAVSGIQVAAGSDRVTIRENRIEGGAGNGVSLGGLLALQAEPQGTQRFYIDISTQGIAIGRVEPRQGGIQLTFTNSATREALHAVTGDQGEFRVGGQPGTYEVQVTSASFVIDKVDRVQVTGPVSYVLNLKAIEPKPVPSAAFLNDIRIEGNDITAMGLSGIGLAPQPPPRIAASPDVAAAGAPPILAIIALLGNPVIGLVISHNRITGCLQNPFGAELLELTARRGIGGVSLGMCEDVSITDNLVESNGTSHLDPVCGIYVAVAEELVIGGNRVVNNGPIKDVPTEAKMRDGIRGGIVATAFATARQLAARGIAATALSRRAAARIHANVVDQPAGQALTLKAFGPVMCTDNSFSSELSNVDGLFGLAGSVHIFNLGDVHTLGGGTKVNTRAAAAVNLEDPAAGAAGAEDAASMRPVSTMFERSAATYQVMPAGLTQFNDNQVRTGTLNQSPTCQIIVSMGDVAYQANHCQSDHRRNLVTNAWVYGSSLRANGNRLSEAGRETLKSLWTMARTMNDTSLNQGDHCIIATCESAAIPVVPVGNQVLNPGKLCPVLNRLADLMFKVQG